MMNSEEIRQLFLGGGSGEYGIHGYMRVAECPMSAILTAEARECGQQELVLARDVGTVFHALREQYHNRQEITIPEEDPDGNATLSEILSEGHRMFNFYKTYMSVEHLGKVEGQEVYLEATTPLGSKLAGKLDLIVRVEQGTAVPGYAEGTLRGGLYLWDDKTHTSMPSNVHTSGMNSLQFIGYNWLQIANGREPFAGTLVHHIVRHKETRTNPEGMSLARSVCVVLVPPPTEAQYNMLFRFLKYAERVREVSASDVNYRYNLAACECRPFAPCAFLANGRCSRGADL